MGRSVLVRSVVGGLVAYGLGSGFLPGPASPLAAQDLAATRKPIVRVGEIAGEGPGYYLTEEDRLITVGHSEFEVPVLNLYEILPP